MNPPAPPSLPAHIQWGHGIRPGVQQLLEKRQETEREREVVVDEDVRRREQEFLQTAAINRAYIHIKAGTPGLIDIMWQLLAQQRKDQAAQQRGKMHQVGFLELALISAGSYVLLDALKNAGEDEKEATRRAIEEDLEFITDDNDRLLLSCLGILCDTTHDVARWPLTPELESPYQAKIEEASLSDILDFYNASHSSSRRAHSNSPSPLSSKTKALAEYMIYKKAEHILKTAQNTALQTIEQYKSTLPAEEYTTLTRQSDQGQAHTNKEEEEGERLMREYNYRNPMSADESALASLSTSPGTASVNVHGIKPKYVGRVVSTVRWTTFNKMHYDHDHAPPKTVTGYRFVVFYPGLQAGLTPSFEMLDSQHPGTEVIVFKAVGQYRPLAFEIIRRAWQKDPRKGYRYTWKRNTLKLSFNFKLYG